MSVLVEALTLIVPKKVLDVSYPGGHEAFMEAMLELERPPRFVCGLDPHLVNVSFYDPDHLTPAADMLVRHGVVPVDDDRFYELAYVDQKFGPTMPCAWLEWRQHRDGFTYAWLAGTEPGDMATPVGWTPEQSRQLVRHDVRDEPGRCMRIAEEEGLETWLDFETGRIDRGLPHRDEAAMADTPRGAASEPAGDQPGSQVATGAPPTSTESTTALGEMPSEQPDGKQGDGPGEPLMPMVLAALEERGWKYEVMGPEAVHARVRHPRSTYDVFVTIDDTLRLVCCYCMLPVHVPADRRAAVADLINRINWPLVLGCLEMDPDDGEVRYRASVDVEGGQFAPRMLNNMLSMGLHTLDRYHEAVMRVVFGYVEPEDAIVSANEG